MANGDPVYNCALLICCPPASARAEAATAQILIDAGCEKKAAEEAAPYIHKCFDLAPQGSLQAFKDAIAAYARGADYKV